MAEFLEGVRWILERDPAQGHHWGPVWVLCSVGMATGLPPITVFYNFNEEVATLHSIFEGGLM